MKGKRWDLQLNDTLHTVEFTHGRLIKKHRKLLVDGEAAAPEKWRVYIGRTPVTEYPFTWNGHTFTVVVHAAARNTVAYDLFADKKSVESGKTFPDLEAMAQPKSRAEKVKETLFIIALVIVWRILIVLFFPR